MKFILFLLFLVKIKGFINFHFPGSLLPLKELETKKNILVNLPPEDMEIVQQINGLYGLIGPDVNMTNIENLYHLLLGNGIIQCVFFDKGELTFAKHYIRTEKFVYEETFGKVLQNNGVHLLFFLLNKLKILPNIFGLANTALVNIRGKHYALYERDVPYEIMIDFSEKTIKTGNKKWVKGIEHFSAHPNINIEENLIETIGYDVVKNTVNFHQLTTDLVLQKTIHVFTKYLPIVHDFISTRYNYIFLDAPLTIDISKIYNKAMPVSLSQDKPTFVRVINKITGRVRTYETPESIYLFHYAQIQEDENRIIIYAPMYDKIDFSELDIQGRYRRMILDKYSGTVTIERNEILENLDMDFPICFGDKVVFRNMKDQICEGFVICKDLEIVRKIYLKDRFVCGEPRVIYLKNIPYLTTFLINLHDRQQGSLMLINLIDYKQIEIMLGVPITYGFHSFFTNK
jgi:hypothetical protein